MEFDGEGRMVKEPMYGMHGKDEGTHGRKFN